ncbi:MAG: hypothetical protein IPF73_15170 [Betaproteobacteria bacterium]|nr:hypothetical protein [Betaproteobacteria bacterium]
MLDTDSLAPKRRPLKSGCSKKMTCCALDAPAATSSGLRRRRRESFVSWIVLLEVRLVPDP